MKRDKSSDWTDLVEGDGLTEENKLQKIVTPEDGIDLSNFTMKDVATGKTRLCNIIICALYVFTLLMQVTKSHWFASFHHNLKR